MKTKTTNRYQFGELPQTAQSKVLERMRDIIVDSSDFVYQQDDILTGWEEKLHTLGFEDAIINYSGFWSQGDGASFSASVNVLQFLTAHKILSANRALVTFMRNNDVLSASIHNGRGLYCHENTMRMEMEHAPSWMPDKAAEQWSDLEDCILTYARDYARDIYRELEQAYNHLTSDEAIIDTILANEYHFTEDGKLEGNAN